MIVNIPRLVVAGLSGDAGKTVITLGLLSAFKKRGLKVAPFKKGPDYIDAAWHTAVAGVSCRNLDTFLLHPEKITDHFMSSSRDYELALIEGNRGLYDGLDVEGNYSTAELAKLLKAPLVLVVNATKTTRTIAALIKGCLEFDPELNIAGVILNQVAGQRHIDISTQAIEKYCPLPVLGAIPKLGRDNAIIPGRHLGLITPAEFERHSLLGNKLELVAENLKLDELIKIAHSAPSMEGNLENEVTIPHSGKVRIGYFKDSVFTFYYPENLEALEKAGATLKAVSAISDNGLPNDLDALYIGGGFPETQSEKLHQNRAMMQAVKDASENGMPIYAECGGLIYLGRSLKWQGKGYNMAGIFPIDLEMNPTPAGHGYAILKVDRANPFYPVGTEIKGHEFHYSSITESGSPPNTCLKVERGSGIGRGRDGLVFKNCLALYTHIYAPGVEEWAPAIIKKAREYQNIKQEDRRENFSLAI